MKNKKESENKMRPSRARYKCPAELEEIINLVNLIPPDMKIAPLEEIMVDAVVLEKIKGGFLLYSKPHQYLFDMNAPPPDISLIEVFLEKNFVPPLDFFEKVIEHTPQKFKDYLEKEANVKLASSSEFRHLAKALKDFCDLRDALIGIVSSLEKERDKGEVSSIPWLFPPTVLSLSIGRDKNGKLGFIPGSMSKLASLIDKKEFDESRLRKCEICQRIFWAKREDSKTCSRTCLNVANVRRYRSLTSEEKSQIKAQRQSNRDYKNKKEAK